MSVPPFFCEGPATDPIYTLNRDCEGRADVRGWIEELWPRFHPYCAEVGHFLTDARAHFHQRTWELYLACVLMEAGFQLDRPPPDGPDILAHLGETKLWIEATAPLAGSGEDRAERKFGWRQQMEHGFVGTYRLDRSKQLLRYTSALRDKAALTRHEGSGEPSQYVCFLERGDVSEADPFVVAINGGAIEDADIEWDLPIIVRSVFPVGDLMLRVPICSDAPVEPHWPYRPTVNKASGAAVPTDGFLCDEYANVSALLFSPYGIWNQQETLEGRAMITVHNPKARVPLPRGTFRFGREFWADETDSAIHRTVWRDPRQGDEPQGRGG